jgi:DNA polymerase-3 subunit delta'
MALAPWLQAQLERLHGHRGHALLLSGASGMGQFDLAMALARLWLCDQPSAQGACGECASCHAVDVHTHADLAVLMPETEALARDWPLSPKAQDAIDKKERKPSKWIRVDAAREAIGFAQLTAARGNSKVIVVYPAERMNVETANTLLKTLEEPPPDLRFVLATEAAHLVLPTIRSRCQLHPMDWPDAAAVEPWLAQAVPDSSEADRRACLLAAGGHPHAALDWAQSGLRATQWHALPQEIAQGEGAQLGQWLPAQQQQVLLQVAHDAMAIAAGAAPRFFDPHDLPPPPPMRALEAWQRRLVAQARVVEHPFNPGLMLEAGLADARSVFATRRR